MARILYNDEWFEEIASHGHYEAEFEKILQQEAERLFCDYFLIPFKTPVASDVDDDVREPDFALVHKDYRGWWVVEVELGHHSFSGHVLPQVRTLSHANYGREQANYLCLHEASLRRDKIFEMFKGEQPRVLVIVNSSVDGWTEPLRSLGARVMICQMFRSHRNKYLLRLNGDYPSESEEIITRCECEQLLHRFLTIHSPTNLSLQQDQTILLYHEGKASEWERIETGGAVYLHALRGHNLTAGKSYEIVRQGNEALVIRPRTRK